MSSASVPVRAPRRIPFDRHAPVRQVHVYDRVNSLPALVRDEHLQQFLFENSSLDSLRFCGRVRHCDGNLCPWCSRRKATDTRMALDAYVVTKPLVLTLTTTVRSSPSLAAAWHDYAETVASFAKNSWLTKRTHGWVRETEVTWSEEAGWHVHGHWLLFLETEDIEDHARLGRETIGRWLEVAERAGTEASEQGQHYEVRLDVRRAVRYATKPTVASHTRGSYALGNLLAAAQRGDADAWEAWLELERFTRAHRRWRSRSGSVVQ
jgi:hypothetical protein